MSDPCASIKSIYDGKTADNSGVLEPELKLDLACTSTGGSAASSDDEVSLSAASGLSTTATKDGVRGKHVRRLAPSVHGTLATAMARDVRNSPGTTPGRTSPMSQTSGISTTSLNTTQAAIDGDQGHVSSADAMSLRLKIQLLDHSDS